MLEVVRADAVDGFLVGELPLLQEVQDEPDGGPRRASRHRRLLDEHLVGLDDKRNLVNLLADVLELGRDGGELLEKGLGQLARRPLLTEGQGRGLAVGPMASHERAAAVVEVAVVAHAVRRPPELRADDDLGLGRERLVAQQGLQGEQDLVVAGLGDLELMRAVEILQDGHALPPVALSGRARLGRLDRALVLILLAELLETVRPDRHQEAAQELGVARQQEGGRELLLERGVARRVQAEVRERVGQARVHRDQVHLEPAQRRANLPPQLGRPAAVGHGPRDGGRSDEKDGQERQALLGQRQPSSPRRPQPRRLWLLAPAQLDQVLRPGGAFEGIHGRLSTPSAAC